jgi:hypothetical protein
MTDFKEEAVLIPQKFRSVELLKRKKPGNTSNFWRRVVSQPYGSPLPLSACQHSIAGRLPHWGQHRDEEP